MAAPPVPAAPPLDEAALSKAYSSKPLYQVGVGLYRRIADLEKNLTGFDDDNVAKWEVEEETDPEKVEMQERIVFLEQQQAKTAERYEQMRQTLSFVSEQVARLKKNLREQRTNTLKALIAHNRMEKVISYLPSDVDKLKESIVVLRAEHAEWTAKVPKKKKDDKRREDGHENLRLRGNAIVSGTIPQLLGSLLSKMNPDPSFAVDFLCVYTEFVPSQTILQNIRDKYEESEDDKGQRLRSLQMMKVWLNSNPLEFRDSEKLRNEATTFLESFGSEEAAANVLKSLQKRAKMVTPKVQAYQLPDKRQDFIEMAPQKLAMQWTLFDALLYKLIDPREAMKAPDNLRISKRIKKVHNWIANEIPNHKLNVIIKKYIELIESCRRYRNYFGVFTIFDGVCNSSGDAKKLIHKGVTKIPALENLLLPKGHYANYKKILEEKQLPSLPNFNFSLSSFKDALSLPIKIEGPEEDLINFQRYRKVAKVIQEIQYFQKSPYEKTGEVDPELMAYVQTLP
mmetsp:Transcript_33788/g.52858  ORF Transcript_33788/g.52858 Transcript_33788/m.52858 type:complete len:511 (-) Transcript_33788:141-1673(-)|eukprot:CAMPEP_0201507862 /NCGR_PEP_ID=MMETSP0161_2-20130828/1393_1 /ASSEMBLY_ACC=CAM_ASM_000251 /TAXON_ID=180227 /ORGANISM="Neoparamoeba aestuarina, Strain SoJaBio B1-5/56/2" /LENGTH=510 /DNA_ID=CAMNT_0047902339 /DNA_START=44 /DNA_END=1576 /DNA_ORIENTATION=-